MIPNATTFEKHLGIVFKNKNLLTEALTHRSYCNEHRGENMRHNERLEFLGDAVLELIVTEHLFDRFPNKSEGELTPIRSELVRSETLTEIAKAIGLNEHLRLSRGEAQDTGRARRQILANALEAFIGALYKDRGFEAARAFIEKHFLSRLNGDISAEKIKDAKSRLQEIVQEKVGVTPHYKTLAESGPDHDKQFTVGVCLGSSTTVVEGKGKSKQEAEQAAALSALSLLAQNNTKQG